MLANPVVFPFPTTWYTGTSPTVVCLYMQGSIAGIEDTVMDPEFQPFSGFKRFLFVLCKQDPLKKKE